MSARLENWGEGSIPKESNRKWCHYYCQEKLNGYNSPKTWIKFQSNQTLDSTEILFYKQTNKTAVIPNKMVTNYCIIAYRIWLLNWLLTLIIFWPTKAIDKIKVSKDQSKNNTLRHKKEENHEIRGYFSQLKRRHKG